MRVVTGILAVFALAFINNAEAVTGADLVKSCTTANIDAAVSHSKDDMTASSRGELCMNYVNGIIDGYLMGSLATENYLRAYMANQVGEASDKHQSQDATDALSSIRDALQSATANPAYELCIPKNTSADRIPRIVAEYLKAHPDIEQQTAVTLVIKAVEQAFGRKC